ncbi:MAG TPA: ATP-binding protein, partial [Candidatus Limnocylindrales bacterium]|nr:ATP-binding protein [Candidatus Limnocylindrales bacterium]
MLDQEYRVIACNPAFTTIFQWTEKEIAGHRIDELIVPDALRQEGIALSHQVMGGQPFRVVTRRRRKDGSLVDVEVLGVRLMVDNKLVGSFGLYQDISERVRLQQEMLESQKLESLGRLAGGVAHDINNMLTAITVHAQLLEAKLPPGLQQHTSQICLAAERASSTVQQLLAFGRKQPSFPRIIGLNATINELMSMLRPLIREDVGLNFVPFPEELHVQIDPAHFTQALVNLVVNARDAISGRGSIFIRTAVRNISASRAGEQGLKAGDYAMVEVMDTGSGMPPEVKKRVFEPFFTTKGMGKGTGLGLATVYGIVKQ